MGPLRTAWTFPYTGKELVEACKERQEHYVSVIEDTIDAELLYERDIAEYREQLRKAGVTGWENATPPKPQTYHSNPSSELRQRQGKAKKELENVTRFRRQLEHDLERDEHRLYKLTIDDVIYFGL